MVDYKKWDALELSDDSDIEVHPNVDKRSFIRAKQDQIHMEREQRKHRTEFLKYERVINSTLIQRISTLLSFLESHADEARTGSPADIAFRGLMELAPSVFEEDNPPSRPSSFSDAEQPLPTYSKMVARILDEVKKKMDEQGFEQNQRYDALIRGIRGHLQDMKDMQDKLAKELGELESKDARKITSESYRIGFDSSQVTKAKLSETSLAATPKPELLNPNFDKDTASSSTGTNVNLLRNSEEKDRVSPTAREFAKIEPSDFRTSHEFLASHPEIVQDSEVDGLLFEAFNIIFEQNDRSRAQQYVYQAWILRYCLLLGKEGVPMFFKRMATPGHPARELFEKDVVEKFQQIQQLVVKEVENLAAEKETGVETIQLHSIEQGASIQIRVPKAESEDGEARKARAIFESFPPDMRAALDSRSLDEVNKVLITMKVEEAEKIVALLGEAGCLSLEKEIIDATTEEGKNRLREMEDAIAADVESGFPEPAE